MSGRSPAAVGGGTALRHNAAGEITRRRIMRVCERLVGRNGYDAVSIRDITAAARVDVTAVHYHFGSKRDLVAAILEQRLAALISRRAPLLDALEVAQHPTARDVARSLVVPAAARAGDARRAETEGAAFLNAVSERADFAPFVERAMEPEVARYMSVLRRAVPDVSSAVLIAWLLFAITLTQRVAAGSLPGRAHWRERYGADPGDDLSADLIDFLVAALTARDNGPRRS